MARSSGVKNHAVVGESGKKNLIHDACIRSRCKRVKTRTYQNTTETIRVIKPVMIMSLYDRLGSVVIRESSNVLLTIARA